MASASTRKLATILECPICLETLTNPLMLSCFHFCCEGCIDDMKTTTATDGVCYECPLCRSLTNKDNLQKVPIMGDLLEAFSMAKKEAMPCNTCKKELSEWRCVDCKAEYCTDCRGHHDDIPFLKTHTWKELGDNPQPVVDKIIFCSAHASKPVEVYCKDCKQLMCLLCIVTMHKNHTAETIEEALSAEIPLFMEKTQKMKTLIENTEKCLKDEQTKTNEIKTEFEKTKRAMKSKYEQALQKVHDDYAQVTMNLSDAEEKQLAEMSDVIKHLEFRLKRQRSVHQLSETTLVTVQSTSLLHAMLSGVMGGLDSEIYKRKNEKIPQRTSVVSFIPADVSNQNAIGQIGTEVKLKKSKSGVENSMVIPRNLKKLNNQSATYISNTELGFWSVRMATVDNKLWIVDYNTNKIHIFDTNGSKQNTIDVQEATKCRAVASVGNSVVVAAQNGLFLTAYGGQNMSKICPGDFCDISICDDKIYALNNGAKNVQIFQHSNSNVREWVNESEFDLSSHTSLHWNTIQVTSRHIFIGLCQGHQIHQYSLDGHLVATLGKFGYATGQVSGPFLCGSDAHDVVLVADYGNHRLQTVTPDGALRVLTLYGMTKYPSCVVMTGNKLFALLHFPTSLQIFFLR